MVILGSAIVGVSRPVLAVSGLFLSLFMLFRDINTVIKHYLEPMVSIIGGEIYRWGQMWRLGAEL